ncbi:MAG TPA: hypothetical protein VMT45_15085 [Thermoanaerobaculaceae bacterium]|nr:hypothetical protein [Thermoanaerobaculaceae bacterium]
MKSTSLSRPVALGLIAGLLITLLWLWVTLEGSAVSKTPHDVPVAVIGPRPAVAQLAAGLQHNGAFRVISAPSEARAIDLVQRRKVDAIINVDTRQVQTVQAASTLTAAALPQALSSGQGGVHFRASEIKPLKPGDSAGLGLMFITMACVLGGLPSGLVLALLSKGRRPMSVADAGIWVLVTVAASAVTALFIALIADGILGYGGTEMLAIWAWGTMLCTASMAFAAALVAAVGIAGFVIAAVPLLFFGVASAPAPTPWNWDSGVFRVLGPFDPFGATTNGIRNAIFFGPASQTRNFAVLAVWIVGSAALLAVLGWRSQQAARATVAPAGDVEPAELERAA